MDPSREHKVREFFCAPKPLLDLKIISAGAGASLAGIITGMYYSWLVGLALVALGVIGAIFLPTGDSTPKEHDGEITQYLSLAKYPAANARYKLRPDYKDMLNWLKNDITKIIDKKLQMEEQTKEPVFSITPLYNEDVEGFNSSEVLRRKVTEGYFYSTYRILAFRFASTFIGTYQANYNMFKGTTRNDRESDIFYKHVTKVDVLTDSDYFEHFQGLSLSITGGETIAFGIRDSKLKSTDDIESQGDQMIRNVRRMVRENLRP